MDSRGDQGKVGSIAMTEAKQEGELDEDSNFVLEDNDLQYI